MTASKLKRFVVQIAYTTNYEVTVEAETPDEARCVAHEEWRGADTIGQWEIADEASEVVAVTEVTSDAGRSALAPAGGEVKP